MSSSYAARRRQLRNRRAACAAIWLAVYSPDILGESSVLLAHSARPLTHIDGEVALGAEKLPRPAPERAARERLTHLATSTHSAREAKMKNVKFRRGA